MENPKTYAKEKLKDNQVTLKQYVGGNHVIFLALFASIVDCDISMEENRKDADRFAFFYQAKNELVKQFETYCFFHKDRLN